MTRTAAVVGGGIGGLAAAIGLRSAGWEVTVFERAEAHPTTGTGLGIWPSALRALDRLGLGERARQVGRPQASGAIRRPNGSRIAVLDMDKVTRRHGEPVYLLSRPALLNLLSDALPAEVVRFGAHVTADLRDQYDVVVGADGINSGVRKSIFGDTYGLRYAGMTAWRGVVDFHTEVGGETWGRGAKFGITPQEDGRTNWYAVLAVEEGYQAEPDELQKRFGEWHDPIPKILAEAEQSDAIRHDLHYLDPPLPSFVDGNVALLGDAAHAMTPDLGQGACQALIDGVALADCLADADADADTDADDGAGNGVGDGGLKAYDQLRRKPAQRIAKMALRASKLSQMRFTPARDAAVKLALSFGPPA